MPSIGVDLVLLSTYFKVVVLNGVVASSTSAYGLFKSMPEEDVLCWFLLAVEV